MIKKTDQTGMQKYNLWESWPRLFLWSHVIGVMGFYLVNWWRTTPDKNDVVKVLSSKKATDRAERTLTTFPEDNPLVSIIVPARNEERNIRRCVTSLLEQDYEHFEVIVVDDGSTDRTGAILDELATTHPRSERLWTLRLRHLPTGWAGKPHAIHRGTQEANGTWLLFTDADTWHAPNALRSALTQALEEQADLFTLGATQELPGFWNKVLMPVAFMGVSMLYPPRLVNDPRSPVAVANGQYILLRRKVYDLIGGYARRDLRYTLLDDRDLARVVKENGFKLRFVDGRDLLRVQMYHSFAEIWRGWRKNAYLGNRGGLPFFLVQLVGLFIISVTPFLLPLFAWFGRKQRPAGRVGIGEANLAMGLEVSTLLAYRSWLNKQMHVPWYYAFTQPLAALLFDGILGQSVWRILTRQGVDWRGRAYHNDKQKEPRMAR
jgi:chlorobactene glucosyltransferase